MDWTITFPLEGTPGPDDQRLLAKVQAKTDFCMGISVAPYSIQEGRIAYLQTLPHVAKNCKRGPGMVSVDVNTDLAGFDEVIESSVN